MEVVMKDLLLELWKMHGAVASDPPAQCLHYMGGTIHMEHCTIDVCPNRRICRDCATTAAELTYNYESRRANAWFPALAGPFTANWWANLASHAHVQLPRVGSPALIAHIDRCYGNDTCKILEDEALPLHNEAHHA